MPLFSRCLLPFLFVASCVSAAAPPPRENFALTLARGVHLQMVWISPGSFVMGSKEGEPGRRPDEGPATRVTLTRGFWLGRTPVTQGQYLAVMRDNPAAFKAAGLDAPVESVSWYSAMEFAERLNDQERRADRLPRGYRYGLPSEAQWEYACRAGSTGMFYDGDTEADMARIAWYKGNAHGTTHPVGQKEPNPWGLYDMLGNLWQWCSDWYGPLPGGSVTDPTGPCTGLQRNNRGGSWDNFPGRCRQGARSPDPAGVQGNTALGFRLALVPAVWPR